MDARIFRYNNIRIHIQHNLEIPSIYCDTIKSYAMKPLYRNLKDALKIASGEKNDKNHLKNVKKVNSIT